MLNFVITFKYYVLVVPKSSNMVLSVQNIKDFIMIEPLWFGCSKESGCNGEVNIKGQYVCLLRLVYVAPKTP